jgi:hypothetical protein
VLLRAVRDFLRDSVQAQLTEAEAWQMRISISVLGIVERELRLQSHLDSLDREFIPGAMGTDPRVAVARGLRDGTVSADARLRRYLRRRSLLRLRIDNPRYSAFAQAQRVWPEDALWLAGLLGDDARD